MAETKGHRITDCRNLIAWQKAMELVIVVYALTDQFPKSEQYGLSSQMQRSAVSIPSNIAEGHKRFTQKDTRHFLILAYSSGAELETQIEIARRLSYLLDGKHSKAVALLDEVMRILYAMIKSL